MLLLGLLRGLSLGTWTVRLEYQKQFSTNSRRLLLPSSSLHVDAGGGRSGAETLLGSRLTMPRMGVPLTQEEPLSR